MYQDVALVLPNQSHPAPNPDRYRVSVDEYIRFRQSGFLVVPGLVNPAEITELKQHTENLMQGKLPEQRGTSMASRYVSKDHGVTVQALESPPENLSPLEKAAFFLRIHMLHRRLELHEYYMLHPRVLDVLEVIIGPDVLAMQTMLFLKPPGKPGQGWHQDSYYIPTHPDTLCGAWIAIDECDEQNGAMWFAKGSNTEPVYPPCPEIDYGFGDKLVSDIKWVKGVSDPHDDNNTLSTVANKYDQLLVSARPGDVVFFGGHVLHRSKKNFTSDRFRRSFVSHYCNARSFTQWGADEHGGAVADPVTGITNASHILARGDTHLPFGLPRFGSNCSALHEKAQRSKENKNAQRMIASMNNGLLGCAIADPFLKDDDDHEAVGIKPGAGAGY